MTEHRTHTHSLYAYSKKFGFIATNYSKKPTGFPGGQLSASAGDLGVIPGSGRSPGEGSGDLLQYYCLENPTDRAAQ